MGKPPPPSPVHHSPSDSNSSNVGRRSKRLLAAGEPGAWKADSPGGVSAPPAELDAPSVNVIELWPESLALLASQAALLAAPAPAVRLLAGGQPAMAGEPKAEDEAAGRPGAPLEAGHSGSQAARGCGPGGAQDVSVLHAGNSLSVEAGLAQSSGVSAVSPLSAKLGESKPANEDLRSSTAPLSQAPTRRTADDSELIGPSALHNEKVGRSWGIVRARSPLLENLAQYTAFVSHGSKVGRWRAGSVCGRAQRASKLASGGLAA